MCTTLDVVLMVLGSIGLQILIVVAALAIYNKFINSKNR